MRNWAFAAAAVAAAGLGACDHLHGDRPLVTSDSPCVDSHFTIYFNEGSTRLTRPADQLLQETSRGLRGCMITRARVIGLADATGTPQANLSLSQRRAVAVAEAMKRRGMPAPEFEIDAAGEDGALLPDGREDPVRRRAEVHLSVVPK